LLSEPIDTHAGKYLPEDSRPRKISTYIESELGHLTWDPELQISGARCRKVSCVLYPELSLSYGVEYILRRASTGRLGFFCPNLMAALITGIPTSQKSLCVSKT
jgi:hypothetical protein